MNRYYPNLGSPIRIGGLTFKNRIVNSPMAPPDFGPDSALTRYNMAYYDLRARGGVALVTISEGIVHMATGRSHTKQLALDNPLTIPSLADTAQIIHNHGCYASIELSHGGKYAGSRTQDPTGKGIRRYGPISETLADGAVIHEMPEELIYEIAESFGAAAAVAKHAGFDMVMIHAAHGWLLHQFMSPATNTRGDRWGGASHEDRMRFTLLVIQKIREAVGPSFPIEFRMSGAEYIEGGYGVEGGAEIAKSVDGKVDLIHVSAGVHENHDAFVITHPSMFVPHGSNVHLAAEIKRHVKTPVATVGGLNDPDHMEDIIASGQADIVEIARQLLADPYFPQKALTGRKSDITKCCRCFTCFDRLLTTRVSRCALNPVIGREYDHQFAFRPTERKRVVVAGGGPGGMAAALSARARGHEVVLFEKKDRLGGQLLSEEFLPFKADLFAYAVQQARRVAESGVDLRLGTELGPELLESLAPDALVIAVGALPIIPAIPGIGGGNVVGLDALHANPPAVGRRVAIIGGGLVGTEAAVYLDGLGREVSVVEMRGGYALDAAEMHKTGLELELRKGRVDMRLNTKARAVAAEGLLCEGPDGAEFLIEADTVLVAAGMRPDMETVEALRYGAPLAFCVGDCFRTGKVVDAVYGGYYGALDI
ncbi:MAG: FAD-dependent oxidoreductase [Clostridiales Family XIII bacterium]|jgi:2,4-dienoyl-CoA reductase-like NADH-dependent reductase (Old Yellow Enzyme family)/NADPH-dependent 2,4-dienoyl-CoA reductase/sulfur reductase-like enzyme|nr:FAD-dependent oxidoreductase [Clostridiales Family XIII bacterium]